MQKTQGLGQFVINNNEVRDFIISWFFLIADETYKQENNKSAFYVSII